MFAYEATKRFNGKLKAVFTYSKWVKFKDSEFLIHCLSNSASVIFHSPAPSLCIPHVKH